MFPFSSSNNFLKNFPADSIEQNYPREVENILYSFVEPKNFSKAENIILSEKFAQELWFDEKYLESEEFLQYFSGQKNIWENKSFSLVYSGHQFWNWAGQLWDGRAINLWEFETKVGKRMFQLKWAWPTPYSRFWDGFAVLRSSIREFLASEAMHKLWIPTTRALNLCLSGELVLRDMYYDGNKKYEKWAIVTRVSESFLRFWNFEYFASHADYENLKKLSDFIIKNYYPEIWEKNNSENKYLELFDAIAQKTLDLVIWWQRVWFVHGVLNTDNMSILWETIDYGPYGFLESFDPSWTPNLTDSEYKRYCFWNQKNIIIWNLSRLADAMNLLIQDTQKLSEKIESYKKNLENKYFEMMFEKIGIYEKNNQNNFFIQDLENLLFQFQCDFTLFFRELSNIDIEKNTDEEIFEKTFLFSSYLSQNFPEEWKEKIIEWISNYRFFIEAEKKSCEARMKKMKKINPKYILRNSLLDEINIKAEKWDYSGLFELFEMIQKPYSDDTQFDKYYKKSQYASQMLSCSS